MSPTETNCQLEIRAILLEKQNNTCAKYVSCLSDIVREFWCTFVKCRFSNTNTQLKVSSEVYFREQYLFVLISETVKLIQETFFVFSFSLSVLFPRVMELGTCVTNLRWPVCQCSHLVYSLYSDSLLYYDEVICLSFWEFYLKHSFILIDTWTKGKRFHCSVCVL